MSEHAHTEKKQRLIYLDSIRGIAALLVAYLHFSEPILKHAQKSSFLDINLFYITEFLDFGKIGVVTFFAISGFVIPYSLINRTGKPIQRFIIGRLFRLYPVYWLSIPLALYFAWTLQEQTFSITTIALNLTMLQKFVGHDNIMGLYWTLQIELIFYVLCVILFALNLLNNKKMLFLIAVASLALAIAMSYARFLTGIKLPVALPLALMFMFWGTVWRNYIVEGDKSCRNMGLTIIGLFAIAMPIIALLAYNKDTGFNENWIRYTLSYYTAAALLLILTTKIKIETNLFSWLGKISYSVYLFHGIVNRAFMLWFDYDMLITYNIPAHVVIIAGMLISVGIAHLTYHYIEEPMIRVGKRINKKRYDT